MTVFSIEGDTSEQLSFNESHLVLYNLHPFYTYSFHIAAVTVGPGPISEIVNIQMPPAGKLATICLFRSLHYHLLYFSSSCKFTHECIYYCGQLSGNLCDMEPSFGTRSEWNNHFLHYSALRQCIWSDHSL